MSIDGLDLETTPPRRRRFVRRALVAAAAVLAVALTAWTLIGIQVDGPLSWQVAGGSDACTPDPLSTSGDVTWSFGIGSDLPFRVEEVRLIGARNIVLVGAYVGVLAPGANVPPLAAGWPSLGGAISPAGLVGVAGAAVTGPSSHVLVLRLRVDDPSTEASFQDVGITCRSGLIRHEKRLKYRQRLVPDGSCA